MKGEHTRFYRDKQNGKILGVCAGIADYTGVETIWIRLATVFLCFAGMAWAIIPAYILIGLFANKKPPHLYLNSDEQQFWQRVRQSPARTAREVRAQFREIDRRLAEVEAWYVSNNPRLAAEIEQLR